MPQHLLTAAQVRNAPTGWHNDGGGLALRVQPAGTRSWAVRYTLDGRRRTLGLGAFPEVTLAAARRRAAEIRAEARAGRDPTRPAATAAPTFAEAARRVHALNEPRWRNAHASREWLASLERHCFGSFGDQPIDRISRADVLDALTPIWTTRPETARRVRQRLRKVFAWAVAFGHIDTSPAGDIIDGALPAQPKTRAHQRAMHHADARSALARIADSDASPAAKGCLRLIALTAVRSGEARNARWHEIDCDTAIWTIDAERMKAGHEHRIPLSPQALRVLDEARQRTARTQPDDLIFPSPAGHRRNQPLRSETLLKIHHTNRIDSTVHGWRSAFRTWALEQPGVAWATAEAALAHNLGNSVERAYIRSDLLAQRRTLMNAWADYIA